MVYFIILSYNAIQVYMAKSPHCDQNDLSLNKKPATYILNLPIRPYSQAVSGVHTRVVCAEVTILSVSVCASSKNYFKEYK